MEDRSTQLEGLEHLQGTKAKHARLWSALHGAERHARLLAPAADAEYRDCSCRGAEREAESHACNGPLAGLPRGLMPNPSFKPSPNSVARRPSSAGPAAHFALAVQRATLSVPA